MLFPAQPFKIETGRKYWTRLRTKTGTKVVRVQVQHIWYVKDWRIFVRRIETGKYLKRPRLAKELFTKNGS